MLGEQLSKIHDILPCVLCMYVCSQNSKHLVPGKHRWLKIEMTEAFCYQLIYMSLEKNSIFRKFPTVLQLISEVQHHLTILYIAVE